MRARLTNFRPLRGGVSIAPDPPPSMLTPEGLLKPDFFIHNLRADEKVMIRKQRQEATTGYVMSLGRGAIGKHGQLLDFQVKVGDHVRFKPYTGDQVDMDGDVYFLMDESMILAVLEDEVAVEERKIA